MRKEKGREEKFYEGTSDFFSTTLWTFLLPQHPCRSIPGEGSLVSPLANSKSQTNAHALSLLRNLEGL